MIDPIQSGIYELLCVPTGKKYIGSSVNIWNRRKGHFKVLRSGTHENSYLQNAFNKYGEMKFKFHPLLICETEDLLFFEQIFLDYWKTYKEENGYNLCRIAGSRLGTRFSDESKKRLSESRKGKCVGQSNCNYGKPMPQNVRKKISRSLKGRFKGRNSSSYGKHHSAESCRKIGEAGKGRPAWNKGLTAESDIRVQKYGKSQRGKKISEEQRIQISKALTGYKHTDKAKNNMSKGQKEKAWDSEERREQLSKRLTGKPSGMKGKHHSIETRERMCISHKKRRGQV